ncbi:MAG TPA: PAS domain S-box protein, partial [Desulfobaccales bacterium]|nr:PAS domain S-box protein [Desulfobaccales bacterium]
MLKGQVVKKVATLPVQGVPTTFHVVKVPLHDDAGQVVGLCGIARDITEVKLAEEALREKEERLAGIINAITDQMSMMDRDYNILWANPVAEGVFGPDLVGKKCYQAYHRREKPCENCAVSQVFQDGQTHEQETDAIRADGQTRYFWTTASIAGRDIDGTPKMVVEVSRDITQRQQAEAALRESEERFRHISSSISDISYSCTTSPDGGYTIDWMAGAAESITGYSVEEIKANQCWRFLVLEEDLPLFDQHVAGLPPGSSTACELRLRRKDGEIVWVASFAEKVRQQEHPELFRIYGGLVDITARRQAEEALRESEERFRSLFEYAP